MVTIQIRNLTKRFGNTVALDNISLRINEGEIFFLLGPSGCGKTTLLRHIAGFYTPNTGQILFGTNEVTYTPPHLRNTAMVFQSYALWPHLTVGRNVAFGLEERNVPRDQIETRVNKALSTVEMGDYANRKINQLSGGQQQRVALARALVVRPKCLLLDEPLSNLDAKLRLHMRTEIRSICKKAGVTAVYVTHDQEEALSVADRMAIMAKGRLLQVGNPTEIYRSPRTRTVADFIGEANFIPCRIEHPSRTEGYWVVDTVHGQFRGRLADKNWEPAEEAKALVAIRPEAFKLSKDGALSNAIRGNIVNHLYLGNTATYDFETEEGTILHVGEANPSHLGTSPKETLVASVQPKDVIILRS
ncbi:MAG: ABC transporter ATP-binding protein [Verrucomicrobiota bacterium]